MPIETPNYFRPAASITNATTAAYGRSLAESDEERDAFTALLHGQLRTLGAMPAASPPGGSDAPPGEG
ncbi:MAG: hypothetical protein ABL934_03090 [Lysobacteraceae bacterium]